MADLTPMQALRFSLGRLLLEIERHDGDYAQRYVLVLQAVSAAAVLGLATGFRLDPAAPAWPVAFIELPEAGQVSWHLAAHTVPWDGHTTAEKYARTRAYAAAVLGLLAPAEPLRVTVYALPPDEPCEC